MLPGPEVSVFKEYKVGLVKIAVMNLSESIVMVCGFCSPVTEPLQPTKFAPGTGTAVNMTIAPAS